MFWSGSFEGPVLFAVIGQGKKRKTAQHRTRRRSEQIPDKYAARRYVIGGPAQALCDTSQERMYHISPEYGYNSHEECRL